MVSNVCFVFCTVIGSLMYERANSAVRVPYLENSSFRRSKSFAFIGGGFGA